jgi:NhaP-type Na+/H+ or K+/H+ antiporter
VHWQLVTLAAILLAFAGVSGRLEGTSVTAAMFFTGAGIVVGADALDLVSPSATGEEVKLVAEATLTVVLFSDASRIDLAVLRREVGIPARLLGLGLPLTIAAGFAAALLLLPDLAWAEALLLAVVLAPTDAALGQSVVTYKPLPSSVRQGLNVESGLNDGICVPLFLAALAVAQAEEEATGSGHAARLVVEKIGYGTLGGVVAGVLAAAVVIVSGRRRWIAGSWLQIVPLAAAALAFGLAEAIGGSGFIAAFVGGLVFGGLRRRRGSEVGYLLEEAGALLGAITFVVFGAVLLGPAIGDATWRVALYAALSLTVVRMLPVAVAMLGTGARRPTVAFLGWFGPRGLASIVFALMLLEEGGLSGDAVIVSAVFVTVALSVLAHGVTAAPLSRRYADWAREPLASQPEAIEARAAVEVPWRLPPDEPRRG